MSTKSEAKVAQQEKAKKVMDLTIYVDDVQETSIKEKDADKKVIELKGVKIFDFVTRLMEESIIKKFFECDDTQKEFLRVMGIKALLKAYEKKDVLTECSWEYVREFFLDQMDTADILNHIGLEAVKEHFADQLADSSSSEKDINTSNSVLEKINGKSKGKNS